MGGIFSLEWTSRCLVLGVQNRILEVLRTPLIVNFGVRRRFQDVIYAVRRLNGSPAFFLMNVFIALKGSHFWFYIRKTFSKFYRRHYELVSKFNVGLKTLLHQGLSEPEFYGDLVYKFKKIVGRADFSDQFRKIIVCYKRIGYNINIMRQSACLVFNPNTVNNFASLFNCTPMGRASDSMMAPT